MVVSFVDAFRAQPASSAFLSSPKAVTMLASADASSQQSDDALSSSLGSKCSLKLLSARQTLVPFLCQYVRPHRARQASRRIHEPRSD